MESKTIKIERQLYNELDRYRGKSETFSDAVRKLLNLAELVRAGASLLGPVGIFDIQEQTAASRTISDLVEDIRADREPPEDNEEE